MAPLFRVFLFLAFVAFVSASSSEVPPTYLRHQRRALEKSHLHKRQNVSSTAITEAQKLVDAAVKQQGEYNTYRVANPRTNNYYSKAGQAARKGKRENEPSPPTIDSSVRAAAALLAEHTAAAQAANGTLHRIYKQPSSLPRFDDYAPSNLTKRDGTDYWLADITHNGLAPMGQNSDWLVYRDVTDTRFAGGAKGDGVTDDTAAINAAIAYGGNCGVDCLSSSLKGTLIYFPPGTYLISTPIEAYYYTQLVGNPNDLPIIKTTPAFIGLGAIESDVYTADGEWYINQSNFYRQVRNFIIDITDTTTASAAGLHWQVAQATSLTNCYIYASESAGTTAMGMFTENGSSGFMGDTFFSGGAYGLYGGNQQYTVRGFEFISQTTAGICLLWDWGWTWSQLLISDTPIGILLINPSDATGQQAGSIYVLDSYFDGVAEAIHANALPATILESSVITLDNIGTTGVTTMVGFSDGTTLAIPNTGVDFLIIGNIEADGSDYGMYTVGVNAPDPSLTGSKVQFRDSYFFKSRPQYEDLSVGDIINVKDLGAMGDGVTDDTSAIGDALSQATTSNLIYFPAGSYIVTETLQIDAGTRITGEVWSQLVASGDYFADMANPQVMLKVGSEGSTGTVEISDMLFTSIGALPGLIMVEWNMAAETQGSVGLWDSHFRVGGATGTKMQVAECPLGEAIQDGCIAATMMLHVTSGSSGYFENMWAWVADHDLDDSLNTQISVAVARGILVESQGPTWFLGTASEHSILYQYNFFDSVNTFAGMIQTESPYFQYTTATESPGVFNSSVGLFSNDPVFPDSTCTADDLLCNFSWAVMIFETTNLTIAGAGLYSWYDNYDQSVCVDAQNCQQRLVDNQGSNDQLYIFNLVTIGAVEMLSDTATDTIIYAANNTQAIGHPFWSILGAYLDDYSTEITTCDDDDETADCDTEPDCDVTLSFDTMDALAAAAGSFPDICTDYYALGVLGSLLDAALANYSTANSGYDSVFGDYVDYTKEMVPSALTAFMADGTSSNPSGGAGNKYFSCKFVETAGGGSDTISYDTCPIPESQYDYVDAYTMTYTLKDSDGFFSELASTYGINESWVEFSTVRHYTPCTGGNEGGDGGHNLDKRCDTIDIYDVGIPVSSGKIVVTNPKDIITSALPTIGALQNTIIARQMDLSTSKWYGATDDILQTISMPVFLIVQAVQSMAEVKEVGEKEAAEKKRALILEILGIVFAFIPFLDDLAPAIEGLDGVFEILAAAGNTALAIQGIIADPSSAPMEILGALTAGGARDEKDFEDMAAARRAISTDELTKIGTTFEKMDSDFQAIIKRDCKL